MTPNQRLLLEKWEDVFNENNNFEKSCYHAVSQEPCAAWSEGQECCLENSWIKEFIKELLEAQKAKDAHIAKCAGGFAAYHKILKQ